MVTKVQSLIRVSKDAALAFSARTFFNTKFRGIGEMTELSIDTKKRALRVRLDLVGEAEPIEIQIHKYDLKRTGETTLVTVVDATASRQWLSEVLREFVVGRRFTIPAKAGAVLKLLGIQ